MAFSTVLKYGILSQVSESGPPFPSDGLTHYYRFDEESGTATKNQITNNNATANNSRVLGSSGFHNNGADFTQGNDYITSADLKSLGSMMAEPMSFSFWINLTDDNFRVVSVFYGDYLSFNIYIDNNKPTVYFRSSNGNTYACNANYSLSTGQWYLLTFVFDAPERDVKFYVDGDEKTITVIHNTGAPTGFSDFGDDIRIGCRDVRGSYDSFFDAKLDELAVWNRALTEQEITDLYNSGAGRFLPIEPYIWTGLTAYYRFDEVSGTIVNDALGDYNLTMVDSSIRTTNGFNNNGIELSGDTNDYRVSGNTLFGITSEPLTYSFWMKKGANWSSSDVGALFDHSWQEGYYYGVLCYFYNNNLNVQIGNGGIENVNNRKSRNFTNPFPNTDWYHVVIIVNDYLNKQLFVNGTEFTTYADSGGASSIDWSVDKSILFGYRSSTSTSNLLIDEFAIWNRALTQEEITAIYNSGAGLFY